MLSIKLNLYPTLNILLNKHTPASKIINVSQSALCRKTDLHNDPNDPPAYGV